MSAEDALRVGIERIHELEQQNAELALNLRVMTKLATDRAYFMEAYRNMLGEKGLEVAKMWDDKRVQRVHFSWGPEGFEMTGEERAQHILDWENAPRTILVSLDD